MLKYVGNYISEVKYARKYWIFNKKNSDRLLSELDYN